MRPALSGNRRCIICVGGKWTLRVDIALLSGHTRFNDLQRTITGISARVLSGVLKDLEINGLVERVIDPLQIPVVIEYIPTQYSKTLKDVILTLADWGVRHKKKITSRM